MRTTVPALRSEWCTTAPAAARASVSADSFSQISLRSVWPYTTNEPPISAAVSIA